MNADQPDNDGQPEPAPEGEANPEAIAAAKARDEAAAAAYREREQAAEAAAAEEPNAADKAIVAAQRDYIGTVMEVMGAEAEIIPCPTCHGFAFLPAEVPPSPIHETCPDCQGRGHVRTGSLVESQRELSCPTCNGNGWKQKLRPVGDLAGELPPAGAAGSDQLAGGLEPLVPQVPPPVLT